MIRIALALLLAAGPTTFSGIPVPPEAVFEPDLTKAATARAQVEIKAALTQLDRDASIPADSKGEIRKKIERLKLAVYTTPRSLEETVAFYEGAIASSNFLRGERNLLEDARDVARERGFTLPGSTVEGWGGKLGISARWNDGDRSMEVDVEDHLVDPRDGTIRKKTVILLTNTR